MNILKQVKFSILLGVLFGIISCSKNTSSIDLNTQNSFENWELIGQTSAIGAGTIVKLFSDEPLFVGYNNMHFAVYDSVNTSMQISDVEVTFRPMMEMEMDMGLKMDMESMKHSCPFEAPTKELEPKTNTFKGAIVFIMPSTAGNWTIDVHVKNNINGKEGDANIPITVIAPKESKLISFVSENDQSSIFVTRITPLHPMVGVNDLQFGIYKKESMMDFSPIDTYTLDISPEMPTMGHGSPNNVNPVSSGLGKYDGKLNFTMSGYWKVSVDFFTKDGITVKTGESFDVTFQ